MKKLVNSLDNEITDIEENYKNIKFVLCIILFANLVVAITKLLIGYFINSTSLSTDGIHSLSDGLSNIVGLVGITIASKPVDDSHPYGHKKFEIMASLFIGGMLLFLGMKTLSNAFDRLLNPQELNITIISIISLIVTICINTLVTIYEGRKGKEYDSHILISDSIHTKSDIFISIGVLISLIGIRLGVSYIIDPIISMIISLFILHASYEIFKESICILSDGAVVQESEIRTVLDSFDDIKDIHKIRSRGCSNDIYIDMHIMIDSNTTTEEAHSLSHSIEKEIKNKINRNCQVIIHVEPYYEEENIL